MNGCFRNIEILADGAGRNIGFDICLDSRPVLAHLLQIGKRAVSTAVSNDGIVALRKVFNVNCRNGMKIDECGDHLCIRSNGEIGAQAGHFVGNLVRCPR